MKLINEVVRKIALEDRPASDKAKAIFSQMNHWPGLHSEDGWMAALTTLIETLDPPVEPADDEYTDAQYYAGEEALWYERHDFQADMARRLAS